MAKQTLNAIKNWFKTGLKPTQQQFWDTWDSFWHKDQVIPASSIENLDARFDEKADKEAFEAHLTDPNAHGINTLINIMSRPAPIYANRDTIYKLEWTTDRIIKYGKYARPFAVIKVPDTEVWKPVLDCRIEYNDDGTTKFIEWDLDGYEAKIFEN
ncbi:hypothetical protein ACTJKC_24800 [Pedobacter sp. 22226]|uniref:hypothetical protein n=1 Tax=Pedobacter sp. 22226 TaxID=3453894 RepID=UPI003F84075C